MLYQHMYAYQYRPDTDTWIRQISTKVKGTKVYRSIGYGYADTDCIRDTGGIQKQSSVPLAAVEAATEAVATAMIALRRSSVPTPAGAAGAVSPPSTKPGTVDQEAHVPYKH